MNDEDIKNMRMGLGKFLHNYYVKFGEEKYNRFVEKMGFKMMCEYGDAFTSDNLRIMEAEYVTLSAKIDEKPKYKGKKTIIKE